MEGGPASPRNGYPIYYEDERNAILTSWVFAKMRHSLYKYYDQREWADAFLDGNLRFRSLSYFRDYEDEQIRGDKNEGTSLFSPEGGLVLTNQTQGWTKMIPWSSPR